VTHAHAAKPDLRNFKPVFSQLTALHNITPLKILAEKNGKFICRLPQMSRLVIRVDMPSAPLFSTTLIRPYFFACDFVGSA
jgi:hypothetical protein